MTCDLRISNSGCDDLDIDFPYPGTRVCMFCWLLFGSRNGGLSMSGVNVNRVT